MLQKRFINRRARTKDGTALACTCGHIDEQSLHHRQQLARDSTSIPNRLVEQEDTCPHPRARLMMSFDDVHSESLGKEESKFTKSTLWSHAWRSDLTIPATGWDKLWCRGNDRT
jgi:hypothetical protein